MTLNKDETCSRMTLSLVGKIKVGLLKLNLYLCCFSFGYNSIPVVVLAKVVFRREMVARILCDI